MNKTLVAILVGALVSGACTTPHVAIKEATVVPAAPAVAYDLRVIPTIDAVAVPNITFAEPMSFDGLTIEETVREVALKAGLSVHVVTENPGRLSAHGVRGTLETVLDDLCTTAGLMYAFTLDKKGDPQLVVRSTMPFEVRYPEQLPGRARLQMQSSIQMLGGRAVTLDATAHRIVFDADRKGLEAVQKYLSHARENWRSVTFDAKVYRFELPDSTHDAGPAWDRFVASVRRSGSAFLAGSREAGVIGVVRGSASVASIEDLLPALGSHVKVSDGRMTLLAGDDSGKIKIPKLGRSLPKLDLEIRADENDGMVDASLQLSGRNSTWKLAPGDTLFVGEPRHAGYVVALKAGLMRYDERGTVSPDMGIGGVREKGRFEDLVVPAVSPLAKDSAAEPQQDAATIPHSESQPHLPAPAAVVAAPDQPGPAVIAKVPDELVVAGPPVGSNQIPPVQAKHGSTTPTLNHGEQNASLRQETSLTVPTEQTKPIVIAAAPKITALESPPPPTASAATLPPATAIQPTHPRPPSALPSQGATIKAQPAPSRPEAKQATQEGAPPATIGVAIKKPFEIERGAAAPTLAGSAVATPSVANPVPAPQDPGARRPVKAYTSTDMSKGPEPRTGETEWRITEGETLRDALTQWAGSVGWQVAYEVDGDLRLGANATLRGSFSMAVGSLLDALNRSGNVALQAILYDGNKMVRVFHPKKARLASAENEGRSTQ